MRKPSKKRLRLRDAASSIGVSAITLRRWLLSGKVREVSRDRNGWRVFSLKDVDRIRRFATLMKPPQR